VVRNGIRRYEVDRRAARVSLLSATGARSDDLLIAMVGRLHPGKGQLALVEICAELGERVPGIHLVFVGAPDQYEPGYEEELKARIAELGLGNRVSFLGYRDDAVEITAGSDLLAMPSTVDPTSGWREGLPLAPLEAMAVGTPVVGYAEPGIVEAVGDCGELVASGERERLREAIARLALERDARERMRACGSERVLDFELPVAARRMQDAYLAVEAGER
jgi:glycosyltransferase involved in cell wall biosynthesis